MLHIIMGCLGVAILALIALAFFGVCMIVWNIYIRHQNVYEEDSEEETEHEIEIYKNGLSRAAFLMSVSLFKLWKDSGESVIVGTLPDIQKEVAENLAAILSSEKEDEKWGNMYVEYIKATNASENTSDDNLFDSEYN